MCERACHSFAFHLLKTFLGGFHPAISNRLYKLLKRVLGGRGELVFFCLFCFSFGTGKITAKAIYYFSQIN